MTVRSRMHEAEEENPLVPLVLGAIASLDALERAVARADVQSPDDLAQGDAPLADDDPLVLATLGLLGLGRTLRGWLATATDPARGELLAGAAQSAGGARHVVLGSGSLAR